MVVCLSYGIENILAPVNINIHSDLIERCRKGDEKAFRDIYRLYRKAMFNLSLRITGNFADAEDVLQEAFISAFRKIDSFESRSSFGAWLKRIVVNAAVNHVKKQREVLMETDGESSKSVEWVNENEAEHQSVELEVERVKKAIQKLPDGYRIVLSLYLLEGYDHKEIASILSVSESTSKTQYIRAKKKLRAILNEEVYHA